MVFDLGANIGYIMAVAHGLVGRSGLVAAFEPSRICHGRDAEQSGAAGRCEVVQCGHHGAQR